MIEVVADTVDDEIHFRLSGAHPEPAILRFRSATTELTPNGDAALVAALPLAVHLGKSLRIDLPVSPTLADAVPELQDILGVWSRRPSTVAVDAERAAAGSPGARHGGMDTGSVQSVHLEIAADAPEVMITMGDIDAPEIPRLAAVSTVERWVIETNLRSVAASVGLDWASRYEAVAGVAACHLVPELGRLDLPAPFSVHYLFPWSSHPFIDRLWTGDRLAVRHRHGDLDWFERLAVILDEPDSTRRLDECGAAGRPGRSLIEVASSVVGHPIADVDTDALASIDIGHHATLADVAVLLRHTDRDRHPDIKGALESAVRRLGPDDIAWPDNWMAHLTELGADLQ